MANRRTCCGTGEAGIARLVEVCSTAMGTGRQAVCIQRLTIAAVPRTTDRFMRELSGIGPGYEEGLESAILRRG